MDKLLYDRGLARRRHVLGELMWTARLRTLMTLIANFSG